MSEKLRESLSATVDDEADEFELRRVLDEMDKDVELRRTWERFHLIGTLLRRERPVLEEGLRERVWAELNLSREAPLAERSAPYGGQNRSERARPRRWLGRSTGVAVAAGAAIVVAVGMYLGSVDDASRESPEIAAATVNIQGPLVHGVQLTGEISPMDLQRANAYMMHHVQHKALNQPDVVSFVKLVTYEAP